MNSRFRLGTLESRFYLIFTVIFFVAIIVLQIVSFRFTISAVREKTFETKETLLRQLVERINSYIVDMERIARAAVDDPLVEAYLRTTDPAAAGGELAESIRRRLGNYVQAREDLSSIFIFRSDTAAVAAGANTRIPDWVDVRRREWYEQTVAARGQTVVSGSYVQNLVAGEYPWVVSLSKQIPVSEGEPGILLVDLKFNRIRELCESLVVGEGGYTFIVDSRGRYVFHPAQQLVYSGIRSEPVADLMSLTGQGPVSVLQTGDTNYMTAVSEPTGWRVVSVSRDQDPVTGWRVVQITYGAIGLLLFLVVGLVTNFISQGITRPLRRLQGVMRSVETGEFVKAGPLKATDEVRELAREYDIMVGHIGTLMEANRKEQELKRKSALQALQAQINPHFLYNTLDSIVWMAEMENSAAVVKMTSALSRLFRISISRGLELIPLRDEVEHVRSYLTIQHMRYQDKFRYQIQIEESLLVNSVLKIVLQPLVENAIYHGIRNVEYQGLIQIGGEASDHRLSLWVRDNGVGMTQNHLVELRRSLETPSEEPEQPERRGMGVRNVHERIQLFHGKQYGLSIESSPGNGTTVYCRLPLAAWEERE